MWRWAAELSRVRKARRAAVTAISPIVENSRFRLSGIPEGAWLDPYMIGFMVMLISIIARLESGKIAQNSMSLIQRKAWEDITSIQSDVMAEEFLLLSTSRNREFELCCHNAAMFGSILLDRTVLREGAGMPRKDRFGDRLELEMAMEPATQREDVIAAWESYFNAHVSPHSRQDMSGL